MIARFIVGTSALAFAAAATVWGVHLGELGPIGDKATQRALEVARARLEQRPSPPVFAGDALQDGLPVIVSLFARGRVVARGEGRGLTFGVALDDAVTRLHSALTPETELANGRLKLDRVIARGYLVSSLLPLLALGTVPGRDGVGARSGGGREVYLTTDDLLLEGLWAAYRPLPAADFAIGMDGNKLVRVLDRALDGARRSSMFRFRAEEAIEGAHPRPTTPTKTEVEAGARAAGGYLARHLRDSGRFDYEYLASEEGAIEDSAYSLPRHAGATSFLAQSYALDHDPAIRAAAMKALDWLVVQRPVGCDGARVCVGDPRAAQVDLGAAALSLIAALELERTTGEARYPAFVRGLAEFVLFMQRPDGEFCHLFEPAKHLRDEKTSQLFYSGEAAYALALLVPRADPVLAERAKTALDRALHHLIDDAYSSFAMQFFMGEEHWTCMAVSAGWPHLPPSTREHYAEFCDQFAVFSRRVQMHAEEPMVRAQPQLAGAYGVSSVIAAAATPVGSRSEAMLSIWQLAKVRGIEDGDLRVTGPRAQLMEGLGYLLRHQISDDYLVRDLESARGGILLSEVERRVRIDTVQHAGSAMLRALPLL